MSNVVTYDYFRLRRAMDERARIIKKVYAAWPSPSERLVQRAMAADEELYAALQDFGENT